MDHETRRAKGRTTNNEPTLTDQSQARDTDINVIVGRFLTTGQAPGAAGEPQYLDCTELPQDLRGFIEASRSADELRKQLPPQLRDKTPQELEALTQADIQKILTPPEPPAKPAEPKP